jgi:outer membrane usher protein
MPLTRRFSLVVETDFRHNIFKDEVIATAGIVARFGNRGVLRADVSSDGRNHVSAQTSAGRGVGSWSVSGDVDYYQGAPAFNGGANYLSNRAEWGLAHNAVVDPATGRISDQRTTFRFGTSLAFADGAFAAGRPISDSFLIVSPHASLDADVQIDPGADGMMAKSGLFGPGLAGELISYAHRTLSYEVPDAPPGYDLGRGNIEITPPYHAGYRLTVGSAYYLMATGRLIGPEGKPVTLLGGTLTELAPQPKAPSTMFTTRDGRFGLSGLKPGKWRLHMPTTPPLIFEFSIARDAKGVVRLGDLHAVADKQGEK